MLTGNKDVDRKILNELDDVDLVNVCQVNKKAQSLCNDQVFWMNRVFDRFGYVGGDVLRKYKGNRSWSEYYIQDLRKINKDNANDVVVDESINGRLDLVIIALKFDVNSDYIHIAVREAARSGHLDVVKYLVEYGADLRSKYIIEFAREGGHSDVVKYLVEHGADIPVINEPLLVVRNVPLPVVRNAPLPVVRNAPLPVVRNAPLPVVRNAPLPVVRNAPLPVVRNVPLPVVRNVPLPVVRNPVIRNDQVEYDADVNADNRPLIDAITYGHLDVVKDLVERGAVIRPYFMRIAYENGHMDIVHYLRFKVLELR